jgi:PAS domain S-box-containing protein
VTMPNRTESTTCGRTRDAVPPEQRPVSVVYVPDTRHHSLAVPSALRDEHDLDVDVLSSFEAAVERARGDDAVDCIVYAAGGHVDIDAERFGRQQDHPPSVPVVLTVDSGRDADVRRAVRCEWANDVVVRDADTADATLLAHRIERCVTRHREHATARRLRSALDRIDHGVVLATPDGRVTYANPAFEALENAAGPDTDAGLVDLLSVVADDSDVRAFREAVTAGESWSGAFTVGDDSPRSMRLTANPVRDDTGDVQCVVALVDDVTEHKQRERDRRMFREAVEHAGHVVMLTDVDGTIEYVNPAFEATTGYSAAEAVGKRPSILKSGEHDDEFYRDLWETILSGDVWRGELTNRRKNGDHYQIAQTVAPIRDGDGDIDGFVAVNTDITDKKRYESQLERERDRLEEFAKTVAHDLRNPLAIALGHAELARGRTREPDIADDLETSLTALERIDTIVDEVLTLSRQGETIRDPERVPLDQVVETAWSHTDTAAATLEVGSGVADYAVRADETRLRELLGNLFRNSVEHGSASADANARQDRVEHAERDVTVRVGRLDDGDGFYVEDDGPGLPANDYSRVFESGFTTSDDGTGFGLAIVKQIVDAHDWTITATDPPSGDDGARFEIRTSVTHAGDARQS